MKQIGDGARTATRTFDTESLICGSLYDQFRQENVVKNHLSHPRALFIYRLAISIPRPCN